IASKGHFFTQIPQPMQSSSEMNAILESGATSIQSFPVVQSSKRLLGTSRFINFNSPILTTGHDFLHSCRHFLGLHLSELTRAIRVSLEAPSSSSFAAFFLADMGGRVKVDGGERDARYGVN
ncbi:hypothetical protein M427DRAFT_97259, partial [Gonapodya prolifera JEL478]